VLSKSQVALAEQHRIIFRLGCRAARPLFAGDSGVVPAALGGDDGTAEVLDCEKSRKKLAIGMGGAKVKGAVAEGNQ
jgi:hypothetical protein